MEFLLTWWSVLVLAPFAWLAQNLIHEGSHLFVAKRRYGLAPRALVPFPHRHAGKWYFARCEFDPTYDPIPDVWISPIRFSLIWIVVLNVLGVALLFAGTELWHLVIPFKVAAYIDVVFWLRGRFWGSAMCDGKRWKRDWERVNGN